MAAEKGMQISPGSAAALEKRGRELETIIGLSS